MKRLVLDYLRRKAWILGLAGVVQLALGWGHAGYAGTGKAPFASLQFQIGMFMGAFLLSLDLRRGFARVIATLPLTAREIGRAWWWATVGIPAAGFTTLLLAGAATRGLFHPEVSIPWLGILPIIVTVPLWLGSSFTVLMHLPQAASGAGKNRVPPMLGNILWGLMLGGGFILFQDFAQSPIKLVVFIILGTGLSIVGWLRADGVGTAQANFRPDACPPEKTRSQTHRPGGLGGIPRLIVQTCTRSLALGFAMLAIGPLMQVIQEKHISWHDLVDAFCNPSFVPFWFLMFIALTPVMGQLRFLRTLPLSTSRLATVLVSLVLFPLLTLVALSLAGAALFLEPAALPRIVQSHAFALIPAMLSLPLMVWLGPGLVTNFGMIAFMMLTQFLQLWLRFGKNAKTLPSLPLALAVIFVIAVAYGLVWLTLRRSTRALRVRPNPFALAWGAAR